MTKSITSVDSPQYVTHSGLSALLDRKFDSMQAAHDTWRNEFKKDITLLIKNNREVAEREIINIENLIKQDRASTQKEISIIENLITQNRSSLEALISQNRESTDKVVNASIKAARMETKKINVLISENRKSAEKFILNIKDSTDKQIKESKDVAERLANQNMTSFRWVATFSVTLISAVLLLLKFL